MTAAVCLLGGDRSSAEDVLHDVFVAFARRARTLQLTGNLRNYLITICLNRARDLLRRSNRLHYGATAETVSNTQTDPYQLAVASDDASRLMDAIGCLPAEQREVVTLHVHGQLKFREIAEMLDISINTVSSRYRYALNALHGLLAEAGVGSEN